MFTSRSSIIFVWQKFMNNKMIHQFIYFELITRCYRFGQCYNILPLQKKSNIYAMFSLELFGDRKQKESTDYRTFKKFQSFSWLSSETLICQKITFQSKTRFRSNDKLSFWEFKQWEISLQMSCALSCHIIWFRKHLLGNCHFTSFSFPQLSLLT